MNKTSTGPVYNRVRDDTTIFSFEKILSLVLFSSPSLFIPLYLLLNIFLIETQVFKSTHIMMDLANHV